MYYIGVDLGTSAVKLLLMDEDGTIMNIVSKEYPLEFPHPGWSQQNPLDWYEKSMDGIKELTEGIDKSKVAGIGCGGQMHGLVTLDKDDQVRSERTSCPNIPPISLLQALPRRRSSGCRRMSLSFSHGSRRSCFPKTMWHTA